MTARVWCGRSVITPSREDSFIGAGETEKSYEEVEVGVKPLSSGDGSLVFTGLKKGGPGGGRRVMMRQSRGFFVFMNRKRRAGGELSKRGKSLRKTRVEGDHERNPAAEASINK